MSNNGAGPPQAIDMLKTAARRPQSPTSEVMPTAESLAAWMDTPEFALMQAVVLETMQEYERGLKGLPAGDVGRIGLAQGFCLCAESVASSRFAGLLARAQAAHEGFDGGQSLLFGLRLHLYRESQQSGTTQGPQGESQ